MPFLHERAPKTICLCKVKPFLFTLQLGNVKERPSSIFQQAAAQIPWFHNCTILDKVQDAEQRQWYIGATIEHGWSRAVRRNMERFPEDFMFQLTKKEFENLRYHFGTSSWGGTRYMPLAFTEEGVAMLSSL